jgi:DNA-binding MarR family transcriptional regulator
MFKELNPLLHSELRLGVMSILISVDSADFTYIRKATNATAGNLSVQIEKLSQAGYIAVTKGFNGKIPCTTCRITKEGVSAFHEYVDALQSYIARKK